MAQWVAVLSIGAEISKEVNLFKNRAGEWIFIAKGLPGCLVRQASWAFLTSNNEGFYKKTIAPLRFFMVDAEPLPCAFRAFWYIYML